MVFLQLSRVGLRSVKIRWREIEGDLFKMGAATSSNRPMKGIAEHPKASLRDLRPPARED
jgi:hypothetical protein